jgi:ABC-type transport system involved in multi-copper enzyme maturation permease subunit
MIDEARRVVRFHWPRALLSRRGLVAAALLAWPLTGADPTGLYLDILLPLAALIHGTRLIRDDVEARTIVYLLSRPLPRPALLTGAFAAYLAAVFVVAIPAVTLGFVLTGGNSLLRVLAAAVLALFAFGAAFTLLGVMLARPLPVALILLFGWERLSNAPGLLPRVTLTGWVRALAGGPSAPAGIEPLHAVLVLGLLTLVCAAAAAIVFSHREYVPSAE